MSNARPEELRGHRMLFDLDRQNLQHNLYGVDLNAEAIFAKEYPSIFARMESHREALKGRKSTVRYWRELSHFKSWEVFKRPKLVYQEIQFHPAYALEAHGVFSNKKTFFQRMICICSLF